MVWKTQGFLQALRPCFDAFRKQKKKNINFLIQRLQEICCLETCKYTFSQIAKVAISCPLVKIKRMKEGAKKCHSEAGGWMQLLNNDPIALEPQDFTPLVYWKTGRSSLPCNTGLVLHPGLMFVWVTTKQSLIFLREFPGFAFKDPFSCIYFPGRYHLKFHVTVTYTFLKPSIPSSPGLPEHCKLQFGGKK